MKPSSPDLPLGFLINTIGRLLSARAQSIFAKSGLDPVLVGVMWMIHLMPGRTQKEYAKFQSRDVSTYGRIVDKLEAAGMLRRRPLPGDRRAWSLELTDDGARALAELHRETEVLERQFTHPLDRRAEAAMREGLAQMLIALGGLDLGNEDENT